MRSAYLSVISTIRFPFATFLSGGWHATYNLSREMKINPAGASRKDFFSLLSGVSVRLLLLRSFLLEDMILRGAVFEPEKQQR